ncbi:uncharacterized protein LOC143284649 isoform X2 [Babylonia areolata]|uniref:uncharacterized protein LOC143284649 isoform X2 n=2 Tax=Babylonia areolata TaxID=304850 RepID=UPI003FD42BA4
MERRRPNVEGEFAFVTKTSKTSKRIALPTDDLETKGVPRFMRETKSKKLTLEPITSVSSKISQTPSNLDGTDAGHNNVLVPSRPLLPRLKTDVVSGADHGTISDVKLKHSVAHDGEEGLDIEDQLNDIMSRHAYLPPQAIHLDETLFGFQSDSKANNAVHVKSHEKQFEENANNCAHQSDGDAGGMDRSSPIVYSGSGVMGEQGQSVGGPYAAGSCDLVLRVKKKKPQKTVVFPDLIRRKHTTMNGLDKDSDLAESLSRSKTMPALGRPKLNRKLSTVNDGERLRIAKETVEKAIKYRKVFTIQGGYSSVRHSLRRRGWVEKFYKTTVTVKKTPTTKRKKNTSDDDDDADDDDDDDDDDGANTDDDDNDQPKIPPWEEEDGLYGIMSRMLRNTNPSFFWVLKRDAIDHRFLTRDQMVNHYFKAGSFTTKVGLCMNMKSVRWYNDVDPHTFFPRCYRLSNDEDKQAFIEDFRLTACMNILKYVVQLHMDGLPSLDDPELMEVTSNSEASKTPPQPACTNRECTRSRPNSNTVNKCVCTQPAESQAQNREARAAPASAFEGKTAGKKAGEEVAGMKAADPQSKSVPQQSKANEKKKKRVFVPLHILETAVSQCEKFLAERDHADIDRQDEKALTDGQWDDLITWYYHLVHEKGVVMPMTQTLLGEVENLVTMMRRAWPQFEMDGMLNVWIVKPGAKSRGRGIACYNRLEDMLKLVNSQVVKKDGKYVVQKYMERPLLVYNTKFDIRQWFLVTDWNPLTLWFYQDSYLRFCSHQYTLDDFDQSIHLSNYSIQKHFKNGPRSSRLPPDNMWTHEQFKDFLRSKKKPKAWEEIIYPGMKRAIISSLLCTQDLVEYRKSSFELYGADFMLTEDLQPWLIEINSSPSMEASTHVTARLCNNVLDDTIKVAVDRKYDKNCDVGAFELAYKQPLVTVPPYVGINLSVNGQAIRKPGGFSVKRGGDIDALFTPRPVLRQINADKNTNIMPKKPAAGPAGVSSAGSPGMAGNRKEAHTPENSSTTSCPPKTEVTSTVVQVDGKGGVTTRYRITAQERDNNSNNRGENVDLNKPVSELQVPNTQTLPESKVVYTQAAPLLEAAGNKRIVSKTSVSQNYTIPRASGASSGSAARSLVVNNVENSDLKVFKPNKGKRRRKPTHIGGAARSLKVPPPKLSPYFAQAVRRLPPVKVHVINPALDTIPIKPRRPQVVDSLDMQNRRLDQSAPSSASPPPPRAQRPPKVALTSSSLACSASRQWVPLTHTVDISARLVV